jgi:hypothetical protein
MYARLRRRCCLVACANHQRHNDAAARKISAVEDALTGPEVVDRPAAFSHTAAHMRFSAIDRFWLSVACGSVVLTSLSDGMRQPVSAAGADLPDKVLWAWQRSENLSAIDPHEFGVAYLACHVMLSGTEVHYHWRDQPLKVPPRARLVPVVRLDTDYKKPPAFSDDQIAKIVHVVEKISRLPQTSRVQIDFDALETERPSYRRLLERIRTCLPERMPLSITALASWCLFDNWIKDLPVDETVPMMFSLGRERKKILLYFHDHRDFLVAGCCKSLGLSLEDTSVNKLMIPLARQRKIPVRVYVFTRTAWNEKKIQAVRSMLSQP